MSTRRIRSTKVDVPISPQKEHETSSSTTTEPTTTNLPSILPNPLEAALLALYPATLIFGSLYSTLHPATRAATYSSLTQSYEPATAPSYFAQKSNLLNIYFVKIGWLWTTLAFALFVLAHPHLGPPLTPALTRRRLQAGVRYVAITTAWIFVTQWFFGAPIIDRSYRWTGGQCAMVLREGDGSSTTRGNVGPEEEEMGDVREVLTHAACKAIGGQWRDGHDISGHVFLLILGSAMLLLELLPAVSRSQRVEFGVGGQVAMGVAWLSWWMLFMTAAYFHTWFEKLTGMIVALSAIFVVYFLPRAVPGLRSVLGVPGY